MSWRFSSSVTEILSFFHTNNSFEVKYDIVASRRVGEKNRHNKMCTIFFPIWLTCLEVSLKWRLFLLITFSSPIFLFVYRSSRRPEGHSNNKWHSGRVGGQCQKMSHGEVREIAKVSRDIFKYYVDFACLLEGKTPSFETI